MSAKIRVKCPHCGEANNVYSVNDACPQCKKPLGLEEEGSIYIYRQGSPYGVAGGFGLFINEQSYGHIGNKELLRIPVKYGTYNIHSFSPRKSSYARYQEVPKGLAEQHRRAKSPNWALHLCKETQRKTQIQLKI